MRRTTVIAGTAALLLAPAPGLAQTWGQPAEPPPPQQQPLEAGGLTPPSSQPEPPPQAPSPTEQQLAQADREDSGRGLEYFWILGEAGFQYLGLEALSAGELAEPNAAKLSRAGPVFGGALGTRLFFLTAGARFRYGSTPDWGLWTLNGEVGMRWQLGQLDPHVAVGGGYAAVRGLEPGPAAAGADLRIRGWNLRLLGGIDWYLSSAFSLGMAASWDVLFLSRPRVSGGSGVYAEAGSGIGTGAALSLVAGLHF
jgi:hypothetical protein